MKGKSGVGGNEQSFVFNETHCLLKDSDNISIKLFYFEYRLTVQ